MRRIPFHYINARGASMSILSETRFSDSPFVETFTHGRTLDEGSSIRPPESHWHLVLVQNYGQRCNHRRRITEGAGGEVGQRRGNFVGQVQTRDVHATSAPRNFLNTKTMLPRASSQSFWLHSSAVDFFDFENVDTFLHRPARDESLVYDPSINAALQDQCNDISSRTLRHHLRNAMDKVGVETRGQLYWPTSMRTSPRLHSPWQTRAR